MCKNGQGNDKRLGKGGLVDFSSEEQIGFRSLDGPGRSGDEGDVAKMQ